MKNKNSIEIDWLHELQQKRITKDRWKELATRSSSWITCACGNLCDDIPRCYTGEPKDAQLSGLGMLFHREIRLRKKHKALKTLLAIEQVSDRILKEMKK